MLYEKIQKAENNLFELTANQIVDSLFHGKHTSSFKGFSSEFKEYKAFQLGENTRNIDWKIFAKTDKLYSKNYYNDASMKVYFILDASSSMFYPNELSSKLKRAVELIAIMCQILQLQKDLFSVIIISDKVELHSQMSSTLAHLKETFQNLNEFYQHSTKQITTNFIPIIQQLIPSIKRKSKIYFLSDLMYTQSEANLFLHQLAELKSLKNDISAFHLYDESEVNNGEDTKKNIEYVDIETNTSILTDSENWQTYLNDLQAYKRNQIIIPLLEKGIKVSQIKINDSLLENIKTTF
jgi:uncharacterized protein (DUF58 family)